MAAPIASALRTRGKEAVLGTYYAAMDIGTNSCRLIVVERDGGSDYTHARETRITRIGEGLGNRSAGSRAQAADRFRISRAAMDRTLAALADYKAIIAGYPVKKTWLVGTQALREAANGQAFAAEVKEKLGFALEIISGDREAYLSYLGAVTGFADPAYAKPMVLDIGAGSTELIWEETAEGGTGRIIGASAPIGALRLLERPMPDAEIRAALTKAWEHKGTFLLCASGTVAEAAWIGIGVSASSGANVDARKCAGESEDESEGKSEDESEGAGVGAGAGAGANAGEPAPGPLVAVGGTATTLGAIHLKMKAYDPDALLGLQISKTQVEATVAMLEGMASAERLTLPGMMPGREDVMPWGLRILLAIMSLVRQDTVAICDRDLLYGLLQE